MWETYRLPSRGNFSLRQFIALFLAATVSAFLWVLLQSPLAHAADGTWQNGNISYSGKTYQADSSASLPGVQNVTVYTNKDAGGQESVVYFDSSTDTTKQIKANTTTYTVGNDGTLSNPSPNPPTAITLDAESGAAKQTTSCSIAGVGWIVCTVSRWIASAMDGTFAIIESYMDVAPVSNNTSDGLFQAWEIGKNLANLCFVLVFLIIIYSQITSTGMNNYDIKKMIPKLIVAAILVNLSYYICGYAVDISNILGHGIQAALEEIRKSMPVTNTAYVNSFTWKNVTEYVLSGGSITAGLVLGGKGLIGGTIGGNLTSLGALLTPVLVAALLAVLVTVMILAARQALIIALIVISPLAFVATLLPNTEKWFDRWMDTFMTMLMVFPLFSLLFGGSQLASHIILQSADQLSVMIFALFIQAAPLAITPFLVKFSGSLVGRIASMVNNPQKGIIDRTRNWANEKAEVRKGITSEKLARAGGRGGHALQRMAYRREMEKKNREGLKKRGESWMNAEWANDPRNHNNEKSSGEADVRQKYGHSISELQVAKLKVDSANLSGLIGKTWLNEDKTKNLNARQDAAREEMRAGKNTGHFGVTPGTTPTGSQLRFGDDLATEAASVSQEAKALAHRTAMAQSVQNTSYANSVLRDAILAQDAGGILGDAGVTQAKAQALQTVRADFGKNSAAIEEMMDHYKLSGDQVKDIANMRNDVTVAKDGVSFTFKANDEYAVDAAIHSIFEKKGNYADMRELVIKSGTDAYEPYLNTIAAGVASKMASKAGFMGGRSINTVTTGGVASQVQFDDVIRTAIAGGKLKPEFFATNDTEALNDIYRIMVDNMNTGSLTGSEASSFHNNVQKLSAMARATIDNNSIAGGISDGSMDVLEKIRDHFGGTP